MSFRLHRTLWQALLISLLIHVVLLIGVVSFTPEQGDAPAVIRASIGGGRQKEAVMNTDRPVTRPEVAAVPLRAPAPVPSTRSTTPAPSQVAAPVIRSESGDANKTGSRESSLTDEASAPGLPGKGAGHSVSAASDGVSPDEVRQYRMALATAMRRYKRYPALARDRGWEGTTGIALSVSSRSMVPEVVLAQSSGRSVLDEQALEMVAQAARVTRMPDGLKGRSFRVLLPVQFSLEDDR